VGVDVGADEQAVLENMNAVVGKSGKAQVVAQRVVVAEEGVRVRAVVAAVAPLKGLPAPGVGTAGIGRGCAAAGVGDVVGVGHVVGGSQRNAAAVAACQKRHQGANAHQGIEFHDSVYPLCICSSYLNRKA